MTLQELKPHIEAILKAKREVKISEDPILIELANEHILYIANNYKVVNLMTTDLSEEILRQLDDEYYMRKPNILTSVNDDIELDSELMYAVSNYVAMSIASEEKNERHYRSKASRIVKDYSFKLYKTKAL